MTRTGLSMILGVALICGLHLATGTAGADYWPMLGRDGTRNGVSSERGAPLLQPIEERQEDILVSRQRNVLWSASLGWQTHSSPVVSAGLIWIGTSHHYAGDLSAHDT